MPINLSTKGIEDLKGNLENLPSSFYQITDDLNNTKYNAQRIFVRNYNEIEECIRFRNAVYEKIYDEYLEVFNRTIYNESSNEELKKVKMSLDSAGNALDEAKKTREIINNSFEEFCDIFSDSSDVIDCNFDDLSTRIKIVVNKIDIFIEEINKSDEELKAFEITNTNGEISTNVNLPNAVAGSSVSARKDEFLSIKSVISSFFTGSPKENIQSELKSSYFGYNLQREKFIGLDHTNEQWHETGDYESYNSPEETGKKLDSNQGKFGNFLGTCGCVSCVNILLLAGITVTEAELVLFASTHTDEDGETLCISGSIDGESNGGTSPTDRLNILAAYGMDSTLKPATIENIFTEVGGGHGVIASVHADMLYDGIVANNDYHAVTITSVKTKNGKPYSVTICDSNNMPSKEYTVDEFKRALTGKPLNVTSQIIR